MTPAPLPAAYARIQNLWPSEYVIEPLAVHLVGDKWEAFCDRRDRVQRTWPRLCRDCGMEFRGPGRTLVRCAACRGR
jgi:hypothetical protein